MPAVAAVFVIAGCGSGVAGQAGGAPITPDHPAPPIVAANETPPDDIQQFLKWDFEPDDASSTDDQLGQSSADLVCTQSGSSAVTTDCPQPSPEETAKAQAEDEQYTHAISPAAGSEPVVVAKLELGAGQELFFTEWTATTGDPCWEIDEEGRTGVAAAARPARARTPLCNSRSRTIRPGCLSTRRRARTCASSPTRQVEPTPRPRISGSQGPYPRMPRRSE